MRKFIFYWKDGTAKELSGKDCVDALERAGYGYGCLSALECWITCLPNASTDK